jgi:hypothetical protein
MIRYLLIIFLFLLLFTALAYSQTTYNIHVDRELHADEAIKVALEDLITTGESFGLKLSIAEGQEKAKVNAIIIGTPDRNKLTADLVKNYSINLQDVTDPQGYEIITLPVGKGKIIIVAGWQRQDNHCCRGLRNG